MGKDATLVRYDAGTFGAGAGFGFCFPPILIGPVPVQICIGGSFRVEGRFAIGYDTSGLRKVLEGGTGTHLLDGIFIDDYNANGAEVPEVKFIGTVYAEGASASTSSRSASEARSYSRPTSTCTRTTRRTASCESRRSSRRLKNPLCLFDVSGKIEAALSAFVEDRPLHHVDRVLDRDRPDHPARIQARTSAIRNHRSSHASRGRGA